MRQKASGAACDSSDRISGIPALARGDLMARWEQLHGTRPHKMISTKLLVRAIAYATQAERQGGLAKRSKNMLRQVAGAASAPTELQNGGKCRPTAAKPKGGQTALPRAGVRLVREWNGRTHVVEVTATGYEWQGQTYKSLSAIASHITGTRWSGPRFFGVAR